MKPTDEITKTVDDIQSMLETRGFDWESSQAAGMLLAARLGARAGQPPHIFALRAKQLADTMVSKRRERAEA